MRGDGRGANKRKPPVRGLRGLRGGCRFRREAPRQGQVRGGGGLHEIVRRVQEAREQAVLRVEILRKIVAAQLAAGEVPPVIERVGVRVAADRVGEQLLASIRATLPTLGEEVHALVLDQDDAALIGDGFGQHGAQVGAFESQ